MAFKDFPEQEQGVQLLQRSLQRGRLAHAYLFAGHQLDELEALATMQRAGTHLARVVDQGEGTVGVLFLEDVLEELVGEVRDAMRRDPSVTLR